MSARSRILETIRRRQGRGGAGPSPAELEQVKSSLRAHSRGPLPPIEGDLVDRFCDRARATTSTTDRVASLQDVPQAVARYLADLDLPRAGCVWPALAALDWQGAGLALEARAATGDDLVGVTGAFCALAETGTLMLLSGAQTPSSVSLLPETHIAVVEVARVLAHMEDGWDLLRHEHGSLPRAVNFISGPSRTADIEQTIVLGAHGPYRVHVVLVG
ncbi:MAG: lactate utilization protein C [Proteobacteria bacterium]|nr:lactate utilization protein C [Pseudomonadota bacterium]